LRLEKKDVIFTSNCIAAYSIRYLLFFHYFYLINFFFSTYVYLNLGSFYELNENCLQGPKYWCKSIEKANECNAFKHCLQTVWSTHNRYLVEDKTVNLAIPNKCTNCIQCLTADYRVAILFKTLIGYLFY
jgi:hypothetical protein